MLSESWYVGFLEIFQLCCIVPTRRLSHSRYFDRILNSIKKISVLCFQICPVDQDEILHISRQCYCREMWSVQHFCEYIMNKSITKFQWIFEFDH